LSAARSAAHSAVALRSRDGVFVVLDQSHESVGAFGDVLAVFLEQFEEVAFTRQQPAENHGAPLRAGDVASIPAPGFHAWAVTALS
jgi:hypothetical protein